MWSAESIVLLDYRNPYTPVQFLK